MAYMDPGNYGTDIQSGASFAYDLLWTVWLANLMAMVLQYLSGKLGIATGKNLAELVRSSLKSRKLVVPYWLAVEAAAAARAHHIRNRGTRRFTRVTDHSLQYHLWHSPPPRRGGPPE